MIMSHPTPSHTRRRSHNQPAQEVVHASFPTPEPHAGCHTYPDPAPMARPRTSPRVPSHARPMNANELQHRTNVIALIGFVFLACIVALMSYILGATVWVTAASSGGVLTVGVWQFFKTLQGQGRKP